MSTHEFFMKRALEISTLAQGRNFPNPYVGAVIVKDGRIIGEGFHQKYGSHHAEVEAILSATESVKGADIYVTLEPCCHTNKQTPPCAQRLVSEGFNRVFISCLDPNPNVFGKGVELLTKAGIEVHHGILEAEGEKINEVFFHAQRTKRPFIHLKLAQSLDGKIALSNGQSQWITSPESREHSHIQRSLHQAIVVGANTLRVDNPKLNVRLDNYDGEQPFRVVFTKSGKINLDAHLFNDELKHKTIVYTMTPLTSSKEIENVVLIHSIDDAFRDLFNRKIINVFVEGGAHFAGELLKHKLVNRLTLYLAPTILGDGLSSIQGLELNSLKDRIDLTDLKTLNLGRDMCITAKI